MPKRPNKWIADILTPSTSLTADTSETKVHSSSPSIRNNNVDHVLLERKITLATYLLFIISTLTSIIGFVFTDIAVIPVADDLTLYILQFTILNIIVAIYSPFFLVCLFLTFMSRPFHIDDNNNIMHF